MSDICLTDDEAAALQELLSMLATLERHGLRDRSVIEISRELWRDTVLRPAARLRRVAPTRRLSEPRDA